MNSRSALSVYLARTLSAKNRNNSPMPKVPARNCPSIVVALMTSSRIGQTLVLHAHHTMAGKRVVRGTVAARLTTDRCQYCI